MNLFKGLFSTKIATKNNLAFSGKDLHEAINTNRSSLALVDNWIDAAAFKSSCFDYGVPSFIRDKINLPISNDITYTDAMLHIARHYFDTVNYLEIGVSVGKNFFQLLNGLDKGRFTGFDIEAINPVLEKRLSYKHQEEWAPPGNSIKKTPSSLRKYTYKDRPVAYLNADVWDENSWARLQGERFNMIFSDALHTHEAILFEFEMLVKYKLLDEKFIIFWDDLNGKMRQAFFKIIKKYKQAYPINDIYLLKINGWIGEHEIPHSVGIIASFPL